MLNASRLVGACIAAVLLTAVPGADAPHVYAVRGARLVTAAGADIASGTIVIRNGLIDAVGADAAVPPDATVIDGAGLTVYPGLIDMGVSRGLDVPAPPQGLAQSMEDAERQKRARVFRPDVAAADALRADSPDLARLAPAGITTVLVVPPAGLVKGQSALVNVVGPPDEPQIGEVGDYRRGLQVVRTPVALHLDLGTPLGGDGYPVSLLGAIAFVRQSLLDARHLQRQAEGWQRGPAAAPRPQHDPALLALQPVLAGRVPVAFEANLPAEILRALDMAHEFKLEAIVTGAREADQVVPELKARNVRVLLSLNYPVRPRQLGPDTDEPLRELRARVNAPKVPARLAAAGVNFAFSSGGAAEPRALVRNAARAVKEGLAPDAAVRALTIEAARIAGAADRLGSLEKGKIANVVVADGDLFADKTRIRHVFVDGRPVPIDEPQGEERGGGRGDE